MSSNSIATTDTQDVSQAEVKCFLCLKAYPNYCNTCDEKRITNVLETPPQSLWARVRNRFLRRPVADKRPRKYMWVAMPVNLTVIQIMID
jgi:hypothetical protein